MEAPAPVAAERARLPEDLAAQAVPGPFRDNGHHAADGVGAPQRGLRAAENLDSLDVPGVQAGEVETASRRRGIVDGDPIDQHQRLGAGGAPNPHGGGPAEGAVLVDGHARRPGECVHGIGESQGLDFRGVDDADGRPGLRRGLLDPRAGDDDGVDGRVSESKALFPNPE